MGGEECIVILGGRGLQGSNAVLSQTAQASCDLVEYLSLDSDIDFKDEDAKPIAQFHIRAKKVIDGLTEELDKLNHELAHKYDHS